jgi:hypothetical protein
VDDLCQPIGSQDYNPLETIWEYNLCRKSEHIKPATKCRFASFENPVFRNMRGVDKRTG